MRPAREDAGRGHELRETRRVGRDLSEDEAARETEIACTPADLASTPISADLSGTRNSEQVLALQRTAGNAAVAGVMRAVVAPPADPREPARIVKDAIANKS